MDIIWILLILAIIIFAFLAGYYIEAIIHVRNEHRRHKLEENDITLKNHDWKNFKNKPWYEHNI